jgi:hypothetical protein
MALLGQSLEIMEISENDAYYLISKLCNFRMVLHGHSQDLPKKTAP